MSKERLALKARKNSRLYRRGAGIISASFSLKSSLRFCRAFSAGRCLKSKPRPRRLNLGYNLSALRASYVQIGQQPLNKQHCIGMLGSFADKLTIDSEKSLIGC
jgi:hypothetical protein